MLEQIGFILSGGLGGGIKSYIEHKGRVIFPEKFENGFALGSLGDIIIGAGLSLTTCDYFSTQWGIPAAMTGVIIGLGWATLVQVLVDKFGSKIGDIDFREVKGNGAKTFKNTSKIAAKTCIFVPIVKYLR